ncbi:MAG: hypothetical protein U1F60_06990 [Planctomycetota bacterium]
MLRELGSAWWLVSIVAAQTPAPDLTSKDWRTRNEVARAMATAATLDLDVVFRALQVPEEGWSTSVGLYGGRGGGRSFVAEILSECRVEAAGSLYFVQPGDWFSITSADDLVIPHTSAGLAVWLLQRRPEEHDAARARWRTERLVLRSYRIARLWLELLAPTDDELLAAAGDPEQRLAVVHACASLRPQSLRLLQQRGDGPLQDAALLAEAARDGANPAADDEATRNLLARRFLACQHAGTAARLGTALRRHGVPGLRALLAAKPGVPTERQRTTAFAVLLAEDVPIPIAPLLPFLGFSDPKVLERALCALRNPEPDPKTAPKLVDRLFDVLEGTDDERTAAVALMALGACAADVPKDLAEQLLEHWDDTSRTLRPALLTTLRKLGVAKQVPLAEQAAAVQQPTAEPADRTALCAELAAEADGGQKALLSLRPTMRASLVGRVAELAALREPERLLGWLDEPTLRPVAIRALAGKAPQLLPPFEVVRTTVTPKAKALSDGALEVLLAHPDAAAHHAELLPQVLAVDWREKDSLDAFVAEQLKPMAPAQRIEHLARRLANGNAFWLVQDLPPDVLLPHVRRWHDAATDDERRDRLGAELVRLGQAADEDHLRIFAGLCGTRSYLTLEALEKLPRLPAPLRLAIEARIDAELGEEPSFELQNLCDVLWAHRSH